MAPKRRGRPPKQQAPVPAYDEGSNESAPVVEASPVPTKHRGRPPKQRPAQVDDQGSNESGSVKAASPMPPKRRGRPPKPSPAQVDDKESAESGSVKAASPMAPKRRGRPPKPHPVNRVDDDYDANSAEAESAPETSSQPPKRRGRPPKPHPVGRIDDDYNSAEAESASPETSSQPPKRRGRPPKQKPISQDDDEGASSKAGPPKRRGRPPKQKPTQMDDEESSMDAASPEQSKHYRDLPPKSQHETFPNAAVKRRGRPPKDSTVPAGDSKSMETGGSAQVASSSSPMRRSPQANGHMDVTLDDEKGLIAAMKPLSLKRKAEDQLLDMTPFKRARVGRVFVFGTGECAQLGLTEDKTERKFPAPVELNDRIVSVACGGIHNVAVTNDGEVWTWGCNDEKALGRSGDEWVPGKVAMPVAAIKVTAGDSHSMALGADSRVYTWGAYRDTNGLMGFNPNTCEPCATPIPVFFRGKKVVDIASGVNHSLALLESGHIYEWGHIRIGQRVARHHRMDLLQPRLVNVRNFGRATRIFAGAYQSFALTDDGKVFAFGMNQYGQSGIDGKNKEQLHKPAEVVGLRGRLVVKIAGGLHHSLALLADGRVMSFGRNNYGELGMNDLDERRVPTLVPGLEHIVDIACGSTHSLAVSKSGVAYSCGFGEMLQLGNGESEDRKKFEKVGGQQIEKQDVIACAAGAQHSVLVVSPRSSLS